MFQRRIRLDRLTRLRHALWPKSGWARAGQYLWHRLGRLPGTPYSIAAGLASGVAMSLTPFIGAHFFLSGLLAWLVRGNVVASAFGTIVGNPWTFPFIWLSSYHAGRIILGHGLPDESAKLNFADMFSGLVRSIILLDGQTFAIHVWPVWWPMIVGCVPLTLIGWFLSFTVFNRLIEAYQHKRRKRRESRGTVSSETSEAEA